MTALWLTVDLVQFAERRVILEDQSTKKSEVQ